MTLFNDHIEQTTGLVDQMNTSGTTMHEAQVLEDWWRMGGSLQIQGQDIDPQATYPECAKLGTIFPLLLRQFIPTANVEVLHDGEVTTKKITFADSDDVFNITTEPNRKTIFHGSCTGESDNLLIILQFIAENFGQGGLWLSQPAIMCPALARGITIPQIGGNDGYQCNRRMDIGEKGDTVVFTEDYILSAFRRLNQETGAHEDCCDSNGIVAFHTTFELRLSEQKDAVEISSLSCDKEVRNAALYQIFDPELYRRDNHYRTISATSLPSGRVIDAESMWLPTEPRGFIATLLEIFKDFLQNIVNRFNANVEIQIKPSAEQREDCHRSFGAAFFSIVAGIYTVTAGFFSDLFAFVCG
jgi:hypothetical protein